jgi:hypothetical protein
VTEYTPYPTVTIDGGITYADNTISSISIRSGRNDVTEQPQPGYASIDLWTDASEPLDVSLSDSIEVAIQSATYGDGTRTNLVPNPSFETDVLFTQLTSPGGATLARTTTQAYVGLSSCAATTGATAGNIIFGTNASASRISVVGGTTYIASFALKSAAVSRTAYIRILFYNSASTLLSTTNGTNEATSITEWQVRSVSATAPALAVTAIVQVVIVSAGTSETHYLDALMLETGSTLLPYFDGSSTSPIGCDWTGTANASTSTQTGINYPIFTGIISDIDINIDAYGSEGSIARYSITAVGPLSQLNRHLVGASGYAKEFDGTRILNILSEAFLQSWSDVGPTITWNDLPTQTSWASYDATNVNLVNNLTANVDVPGQYELMAYSAAETNAYDLTTQAANSGRGVLWEGSDGDLHYDDYASRSTATALTLTADDILARGLRSAAQWGEIVNDANVSYRAGTEVARDENSIIAYGQLSGTRTTQLHNSADALAQATDFVESRAYPRTYPEQITSPLHSPTVSDLTRDSLIGVYNGLRVSTSALPAVFGTTFDGFVEGYTWNLTRYTAELALTCSAYSETYLSIIWDQEPPTLTWAGYTLPTQEWNDL